MIAAILLILAGPGTTNVTCVDLIEHNHVINACGCESFSQYIFWGQYKSRGVHVVAYRIHDKDMYTLQHGDLNSVIWFDGKCDRQVTSRNYRESWTSYDPERCDRQHVPECERRGL